MIWCIRVVYLMVPSCYFFFKFCCYFLFVFSFFFISVNYRHILQRLFQSIAVNIVSSSFKCLWWIFHIYTRSHTNSTVINITCIVHTHVILTNLLAQEPQAYRKKYWKMYELLTAAVAYEIKWTEIKEREGVRANEKERKK